MGYLEDKLATRFNASQYRNSSSSNGTKEDHRRRINMGRLIGSGVGTGTSLLWQYLVTKKFHKAHPGVKTNIRLGSRIFSVGVDALIGAGIGGLIGRSWRKGERE